MTRRHDFVSKSFDTPGNYTPRTDALPLISEGDTDIRRHNLFEGPAPAHTKNYMVGLDVISWRNQQGNERSQLIIDQKPGSLVLPWEVSTLGGIWLFLQETMRNPHSKDERGVKELIAQGAFDAMAVWSLEAPAGGIKHVDGVAVETPLQAAVRELTEETGFIFDEKDLVNLLPGGLHIGGDVSTKVSHLFAADISNGQYDPSKVTIEEDEAVSGLLAFRARDNADLRDILQLTRRCAGTSSAIGFLALQPNVSSKLV
jgi:hypothetical protein